jgi:hypothetical protein
MAETLLYLTLGILFKLVFVFQCVNCLSALETNKNCT